jgi:hypothetical protein
MSFIEAINAHYENTHGIEKPIAQKKAKLVNQNQLNINMGGSQKENHKNRVEKCIV